MFPGWYHGRTTHIHFKGHYLRDGVAPATSTSQLLVSDDFADQLYQTQPYQPRGDVEMHNAHDPLYRETLRDGIKCGELMTLDFKKNPAGEGYVTDYAIAIVTHPHPSNNGHFRRVR